MLFLACSSIPFVYFGNFTLWSRFPTGPEGGIQSAAVTGYPEEMSRVTGFDRPRLD